MNRKGFTLVELLAALAILGIIVTIGGVAISKTINNTKEKDYETLMANIKNGVETYYQECKYGRVQGGDYSYCTDNADNVEYTVKASVLLSHGYINPNSGNMLVNPKDEKKKICTVKYKYNYDKDDNVYELKLTDIIEADVADTGC